MGGMAWAKWFWSDWESDPALRLCTFAAQGLWMRMLCIAAAHDPIGYVAVAGRSLDETSIARMTGGQESEVSSLLGELERNGVFSRDRHGRIYSRRMIRDARRAATAKKNGKLGGNPTLRINKENSASVIGGHKASANPQKPEARVQKKEKEESSLRSESSQATLPLVGEARTVVPLRPPPSLFDEGWEAYPVSGRRRSGKPKCEPLWKIAAKAARGESVLLDCIKRYAESSEAMKDSGAFVPGFHRWLKDGAWQNWTAEQAERDDHHLENTRRASPLGGWQAERADDLRTLGAAAMEAARIRG